MTGISITFWVFSAVNLKLESEQMGTMLAQLINQSSSKLPKKQRSHGIAIANRHSFICHRVQANCTYCRKDHASNACKNVTSITARKEILKRTRRYFVCRESNDISKDCSSRMKCLKCGRQHCISFCASNTNHEVKSLHTPAVEGSASLPQSQTSYSPPRESNGRPTILYVNTSTSILLQNARLAIYQPTEKFLARLVLDGGSQRSYVKIS